jgi:hypothetical protein
MQVQAQISEAQAAQAPIELPLEPGARCGWHSSSYELRQGLEISEMGMDDSVWSLWNQTSALIH